MDQCDCSRHCLITWPFERNHWWSKTHANLQENVARNMHDQLFTDLVGEAACRFLSRGGPFFFNRRRPQPPRFPKAILSRPRSLLRSADSVGETLTVLHEVAGHVRTEGPGACITLSSLGRCERQRHKQRADCGLGFLLQSVVPAP